MKQTMLENIIKLSGFQGGTIHQFLGNNNWKNIFSMEDEYDTLNKKIDTKNDFNSLADKHDVVINWKG